MALKHVGRVAKTQKKCAVVYRVVPGEPNHAVIVLTESLMAEEHDALMSLIESQTAQTSYELGEAMARARLPDGRNMLAGFHTTGKMQKVPTDAIEMTPDTRSVVNLAELNKIIAEQKGVTVADLALKGPDGETVPSTQAQEGATTDAAAQVYTQEEDVLTDEKLAAQYRSQADALFKEAKKLREQAEELVPTKKSKKTTESA